jgi:TPM domain
MTISRMLVVALAVFFECHAPQEATPVELPRLSGMVNDFPSFLKVSYVEDLEVRLQRFNQKTGYAIVVVIISSGEDERISDLISQLFVRNGLEKWGSAGTVLVLITAKEGLVTVEPSQKVERKFSEPAALQRIRHFRDSELRYRENAVERRIEAVVEILDPWFYVFEGVRSPTAEIILFPLAPLLWFMGGLILMVFTPWGELRVFARFLLCGFLGCFVAVTTAFLVRQPGGIAPVWSVTALFWASLLVRS